MSAGVIFSLLVAYIGMLSMNRYTAARPARARRLREAVTLGIAVSVLMALVPSLFSGNIRGGMLIFCYTCSVLPAAFVCGYAVRFRTGTWPPLARCCWKCDYDLGGNVSGVCPECGTAVKKP